MASCWLKLPLNLIPFSGGRDSIGPPMCWNGGQATTSPTTRSSAPWSTGSTTSTKWLFYLYTLQQSWARDKTTATHCSDYTTMFLGQKWLIISLCLYSLRLLHLVTEASPFFVFFIVPESSLTLSLCRCREYEKLSRAQHCYIGSSWCILIL